MAYGFVYLLGSSIMPNVYKIGCTEGSPTKRCKELSSATGVPTQFELICYSEMKDFREVERQFHRWLEHTRVSPKREFFKTDNVPYLVGLFLYHPNLQSFAMCTAHYDFLPPKSEVPNPWIEASVEEHLARRAEAVVA